MTAQLYQFKPQRPVVSEACKWSSAAESVTLTNLRLMFAWQRIIIRAVTGV